MTEGRRILDEVEDSDPVADGRVQMGAVWAEQQVALAVDCSKQVGEFEVCLHGRRWSISQPKMSTKLSTLQQRANRQVGYRQCSPPKILGLFGNFLAGPANSFSSVPTPILTHPGQGLGKGTLGPRPFGLGLGKVEKGSTIHPILSVCRVAGAPCTTAPAASGLEI